MMKIRTITCHECYNYGASLQAFALQYFLESLGHDVQIINYKSDNHGYRMFLNVDNPSFNKPIIAQLYLLAKIPQRLIGLRRKKAFDKFTFRYLKLTKRYDSYEELVSDPPIADVYIAGSDQIWNTILMNGKDPAFYLDFGVPKVKRISYAASFATADIVPTYREFVIHELKNINSISIREKTSLPLLYSLGRKDGVAVCDPVFLLPKAKWLDILEKDSHMSKFLSLSQKYILVYLTDKSDKIKKIALDLKSSTGWKIYIISSLKENYADKNYNNAGPIEFISLIKNAQFVISNSFHATAFSIIFEKNFCVVNRSEDINERMKSLLADYGLDERLTYHFSSFMLESIDYSKVNDKNNQIIEESKKWLVRVLDN